MSDIESGWGNINNGEIFKEIVKEMEFKLGERWHIGKQMVKREQSRPEGSYTGSKVRVSKGNCMPTISFSHNSRTIPVTQLGLAPLGSRHNLNEPTNGTQTTKAPRGSMGSVAHHISEARKPVFTYQACHLPACNCARCRTCRVSVLLQVKLEYYNLPKRVVIVNEH